ncbi:MAG: hypothetical protein AAF141_13960 [Pseudomonadota bacterium]
MKTMARPRDGIGPEIIAATLQMVPAANEHLALGMSFDEEQSGFKGLNTRGIT